MDAVGQLTGGIAHDFNNLLTIILANLQLLEDEVPPESDARELVQSATRAALRGAELTSKLLIFARRQRLDAVSTDVNVLVSSMTAMLDRVLGEHIQIVKALDPQLPEVFVDAGQLETVLLNLVVNARDAMPRGGSLSITTAAVELDGDGAVPDRILEPGCYVAIAVSDTGMGMSSDIAARAFEPFFTTKEAGRGTGLGLSMVYGFVKQSGGHLNLVSEPGQGTTLTLYLPQAKETLRAAEPHVRELPTGTEAILLVEDDDDVRAGATRMLAGLGYSVVAAADAATALALLDGRGEIRLLLTDVVLANGPSGPELAAKARELRPDLKVLFMSGHVRDTAGFHEQLQRDAHFLPKPFRKEELARIVRLALDNGAP
jgi:CheY-like chemotaxis protein